MPKQRLTEDTPFLRTPDMYQIEKDAPISEYDRKTIELIAATSNGGVPDGANAFASVGKEKRGTVQMQLFALIDADEERFREVGFRSHGCLAAIACAIAGSHGAAAGLDPAIAEKLQRVNGFDFRPLAEGLAKLRA